MTIRQENGTSYDSTAALNNQRLEHLIPAGAFAAGRLPAHRSGQRMASAPGMVRQKRDGRFARGR